MGTARAADERGAEGRARGEAGERAGVIVQTSRGRCFVPAAQARAVLESPRTSPVPGAEFGMLWFEGRVLVAVPFEACLDARAPLGERATGGGAPRSALVCELGGESYALTGVEIVATGRFEGDEKSGVLLHEGSEVPCCVLCAPEAGVGLEDDSRGPRA